MDGEEKRGRVHDEWVLCDESFWNLRTCFAPENLLSLHIPLSFREGEIAHGRFDATDPTFENVQTQRQVPFADHQLVETLVPHESAGEVRAAGDGCEQLTERTCDAVSGGSFLDGGAHEVGDSADEVTDGGGGDGLLRGREGGEVEGGEESLAEVATALLRQLLERGEVGGAESGGMGEREVRREKRAPEGGREWRFSDHGETDREGELEDALDDDEGGVGLKGVGKERLERARKLFFGDGREACAGVTLLVLLQLRAPGANPSLEGLGQLGLGESACEEGEEDTERRARGPGFASQRTRRSCEETHRPARSPC